MLSFDLNYGRLKGGQRIPKLWIQKLFRATWRELKKSSRKTVSIGFISKQDMTYLNETYYGGKGVTDVLAFPASKNEQDPMYLGEILIYYPKAQRQAQERGVATRNEVAVLLVHGLLHLLGYDHRTPRQTTRMFGLQEKIIKRAQL